MSDQDDDWDRLLNPFRYHQDGSKTEAALRQDVSAISTRLNSADDANPGGGSGTTSVTVQTLKAHATTVDQITGSFSSADYLAKTSMATTSLSFSDWQLVQGLSAFITRWNDQKETLENRLSAVSHKLRQNAQSYTATDESQADDFRSGTGG